MATIGLDKLYYAKITEDADGNETYETPQQMAKAMTADLSVELAEATLYADDGAAEIVKEFKSGTLSLLMMLSGAASESTKDAMSLLASKAWSAPAAMGDIALSVMAITSAPAAFAFSMIAKAFFFAASGLSTEM